MLVSVITVCYNSDKTIADTIESVLLQSFLNVEYIIVDGNSSDQTVSIIKSYEQQFKDKGIAYKWISEPDQGIYDAWNKGVKMASGDWISFLGSDDVYYNDALENYANFIRDNNRELEYISSQIKIIREGKVIREIKQGWDWATFKKEMKIGHVGSIHHKNYFEKYGLYDTHYKIAGDYEMLLRAKEGLKAGFMPKFTADMSAEGVSTQHVSKALNEAFEAKTKTGGRNKLLAYLDKMVVHLKISIKSLIAK